MKASKLEFPQPGKGPLAPGAARDAGAVQACPSPFSAFRASRWRDSVRSLVDRGRSANIRSVAGSHIECGFGRQQLAIPALGVCITIAPTFFPQRIN